jgi:hypothetical protein
MTDEHRTFRTLGGVDAGTRVPQGEAAEALRAEFDHVFALKESLGLEVQQPVSPTGRRTTASAEAKLRTLVASVEGASRFAIRLGLLDPGQVRALWSEAMARGLYDGWDAGQSAYDRWRPTGVEGDSPTDQDEPPASREARDPQAPPGIPEAPGGREGSGEPGTGAPEGRKRSRGRGKGQVEGGTVPEVLRGDE